MVTLTAAGCLIFMDGDAVAKASGLDAAGILLVLVNLAYAATMIVLISVTARHKALQTARKLLSAASAYVKKIKSVAAQLPSRLRRSKESLALGCVAQRQVQISDVQTNEPPILPVDKLAVKVLPPYFAKAPIS